MRLSASLHRYQVVAGILPAVEGGILPPGPVREVCDVLAIQAVIPPGETPGSTAGRMPAATVHGGHMRLADSLALRT
jgi:hypothetical protein